MSLKEQHTESSFQVSPFQRRFILIICFLLYMVNFMDRQVLSVVMEPMKQDLGLTDAQAGLLQTAFFFSMAFFAFPASYLVDRWSRRKSMALMAIIWSAFTYVTGMGKSFIGVLLPRLMVGVGEAGFPPGSTAMISAAFPESSRSRALGIFNAAIPLGAALGTILGGVIAAKFGGWQWPFYIFAVPGIILGVVALFLKDYKTVKTADESGKINGFLASSAGLLKIKSLRLVYVGYAMQLAMTMAFIVWSPAFLMRARDMAVDKVGMVIGLIGIIGIVGAPLGGVLADLWQRKNPNGRIYMAVTAVLCGSVMMFLAVQFDLWGIGLVFGAFWGILSVAGTPAVNSISQDVVEPQVKGLSWGMAGFIAMIGGAGWAPLVVGVVSDSLGGGAAGLKFAMQIMALCGILAAVFFLAAARHYPADRDRVRGISLQAEK